MSDPKTYNLDERYGSESALQRYTRLTVGETAGTAALFSHEMALGLCTGFPGLLGFGLRRLLYPRLFKGVSKKTVLARHISLRCPRQLQLADGVVIDEFVQLFATSSRPDAISIGENTFLRSYVMLNAGPPDGYIHIGRNSSVGQSTILYGNGGLTIGDDVMIAGQCFIVASSHRRDDPDRPMAEQGFTAEGIRIDNNVWMGAGVKVLDGVCIGEGAVIGANAVVNRSVAPNTTVVGVPARPTSQRVV